VATGHSGFAILNRAINPLVRLLIRSPLHWLASRRLALITYTGPAQRPSLHDPGRLSDGRSSGDDHRRLTRPQGVVAKPYGHGRAGRADCSRAPANCHAVATRTGDQALVRVALDR
jgi:hypothetical protein